MKYYANFKILFVEWGLCLPILSLQVSILLLFLIIIFIIRRYFRNNEKFQATFSMVCREFYTKPEYAWCYYGFLLVPFMVYNLNRLAKRDQLDGWIEYDNVSSYATLTSGIFGISFLCLLPKTWEGKHTGYIFSSYFVILFSYAKYSV